MRATGAWLTAFPIVLTLGVVTIPVVSDYANHELAASAAQSATRWYWGHLVSALAFAVAGLAACALHGELSRGTSGQRRMWAVALVAVGAGLHMYGLGADGIGPNAVLAAGGDPRLYFDGSGMRLSGVFVAAAAAFTIGWFVLVRWLVTDAQLSGWWRWWLPSGVILMGVAEAIPSGWGLYVVAVLAISVWLPLSRSVRQIPGAG